MSATGLPYGQINYAAVLTDVLKIFSRSPSLVRFFILRRTGVSGPLQRRSFFKTIVLDGVSYPV